MSSEKTDALVIRQVDFSETSRVVTFFTREFGKVPLLAKGARRVKGPFESALDLLAICQIVFLRKSSGSLGILTEARLRERFHNSGREMLRLYGGFYVAELLDGLTEDFDPHPELYDRAVETLARLDDVAVNPRLAIVLFELAVLREIGHMPNFDECVACHRPTDGRAPYAFWVTQGGILCRDCQKAEYRQNCLKLETVHLLRDLADGEMVEPNEIAPEVIREMSNVTTSAITFDLGRPPRTLRYLQTPH